MIQMSTCPGPALFESKMMLLPSGDQAGLSLFIGSVVSVSLRALLPSAAITQISPNIDSKPDQYTMVDPSIDHSGAFESGESGPFPSVS